MKGSSSVLRLPMSFYINGFKMQRAVNYTVIKPSSLRPSTIMNFS